jgi:TolB-like protein
VGVLPLDNLSAHPENAFFAGGVHEEILTQLAGIGGLEVIGRRSMMRYQGSEQSLREIAADLSVSHLLEGSVQRDGDRIRVTVQLIDGESETHIWAERYDRELSDLFAIQSDVATRVVEAVRSALTPAERATLASVPTGNLDAYYEYLRGHEHFARGYVPDEMDAALERYEGAVALDPAFTAAWSRIVQVLAFPFWDQRLPYAERRARAETAVGRLEEMAPSSYDTELAGAVYAYRFGERADDALPALEALVVSRPNDSDALLWLAAVYRALGRWEESARTLDRRLALDPADLQLLGEVCGTRGLMRRLDDAVTCQRRRVSLDPTRRESWMGLIAAYFFRGDTEAARAVLDSASAHVDPGALWYYAVTVDYLERRFQEALDRLLARPDRGFSSAGFVIACASQLGRDDLVQLYGDTLLARAERALSSNEGVYPAGGAVWRAQRGLVLASRGEAAGAVESIEEAVRSAGPTGIFASQIREDQAEVYAMVGRLDDAVEVLRHLLSTPGNETVTVPMLRIDPVWDDLRGHPGFEALLEEPTGS